VQFRTLMSSVKTLAIQVPLSKKGCSVFVTQLLKCFPSLEVLHVEVIIDSVSYAHLLSSSSASTLMTLTMTCSSLLSYAA
jgi:hypothetical protein